MAALVLGLFLLFGFIPVLGAAFSSNSFGARGPVMLEDNQMLQKAALPVEMPPMAAAPAATAAPAAIDAAGGVKAGEGGQSPASPAEPPRLRQYFPETMLWQPEAVTDAGGALKLDVPAADSITTWRVTALASTQDGRLGSATAPLRVFQDFFIDLDLPQSLTVGDEVAMPVGVFNYLPDAQSVRLELDQADWFELLETSRQGHPDRLQRDQRGLLPHPRRQTFGVAALQGDRHGTPDVGRHPQGRSPSYPDGKEIQFLQLRPSHCRPNRAARPSTSRPTPSPARRTCWSRSTPAWSARWSKAWTASCACPAAASSRPPRPLTPTCWCWIT